MLAVGPPARAEGGVNLHLVPRPGEELTQAQFEANIHETIRLGIARLQKLPQPDRVTWKTCAPCGRIGHFVGAVCSKCAGIVARSQAKREG